MVYDTGNESAHVLGCANIEPSLVAEEEIVISFPRNGISPWDVDRCLLNYIHDTTVLHHAPLAECESYGYIKIKLCKFNYFKS